MTEPNPVMDWISKADNLGPFAPLPQLRRLLQRAPRVARSTKEWRYLNCIIAAREAEEGSSITELDAKCGPDSVAAVE